MRRFYSYGPIDREEHYCVARKALREQCAQRLIGHPVKGGHYFTIWAPRQTGKTWLMQEAVKKIQAEYHDQFVVGSLSMQNIEIKDEDSYDLFLTKIPYLFYDGFRIDMGQALRIGRTSNNCLIKRIKTVYLTNPSFSSLMNLICCQDMSSTG